MLLSESDFVLNMDFLFQLVSEDGIRHLDRSLYHLGMPLIQRNKRPAAVYSQTRMSMMLLVSLILTFCCLLHCCTIACGCIPPKLGIEYVFYLLALLSGGSHFSNTSNHRCCYPFSAFNEPLRTVSLLTRVLLYLFDFYRGNYHLCLIKPLLQFFQN